MRDAFTTRLSSLAVVVAALSTLGAVIYLSIRGQQVNEYLAGLAGLTIGALLPSPLSPPGSTAGSTAGTTAGSTAGTTGGTTAGTAPRPEPLSGVDVAR